MIENIPIAHLLFYEKIKPLSSTRYAMLLLDLIEKGAKENLLLELLSLPSGSSVDATNLYNQKLMAEYVKNQALDGWISRQDRSDDLRLKAL